MFFQSGWRQAGRPFEDVAVVLQFTHLSSVSSALTKPRGAATEQAAGASSASPSLPRSDRGQFMGDCESGASLAEPQRQPEGMALTLIDLPPACLKVVCQHLENDDTKNAVMRTCHVLQSAVLESCMVLLKQTYKPRARSDPGEQESQQQESQQQDLQQRYKKQHMRHQQQARMLQKAKRVTLLFEFVYGVGRTGWEGIWGQACMLTWLGEMYYQCKGPLVSVCKVSLQGELAPVASLPAWLHLYCPHMAHLEVDDTSHGSCDMELMAARVYSQLESVEIRFDMWGGKGQQQHMTATISALLGAPQLAHVTLGLCGPLSNSFADRECKWETLRMVGNLTLPSLAQLPKKGVKHLVLGDSCNNSWFTLQLARPSREGQTVDHAQIIKEAVAELSQYAKVTLSTDGGLVLDCKHVTSGTAALALPLLQHARPYRLPTDRASGTLTVEGLRTVTLEFLRLLCSSLPHTITRVGFNAGSRWSWEEGALEQLVSLLPAHVTAFTIFTDHDYLSWANAQKACEHATREIALVVPINRYICRVRPKLAGPYSDQGVMQEWQLIEQSMQAHGHQHVSLKRVDCLQF